ncbi:MAG: ABC transporter permease [Pirellulaceae bacterium]|nr:ABC transporter permease [Pirellulaceae bacterium]
MSSLVLLAQSEDWLANWITPLWQLGLGMLGGLAVLIGLWVLGIVLSRVPGLGRLLDRAETRQRAGLAVSLLALVGLAVGVAAMLPTREWSAAVGLVTPFALGGWLGLLTLLALSWRRAMDEIPQTVTEGPLAPILVVAGLLGLFGIVGFLVVNKPNEFVQSLVRLPSVGRHELQPVTIPLAAGNEDGETLVPVTFRRDEIRELVLSSNEPLRVMTEPAEAMPAGVTFDVLADEPYRWLRVEQPFNPFVDDTVTRLFALNIGQADATLQVTIVTAPQYPQVLIIPYAALCLVLVVLLYLAQRTFAPRLSAIALATVKSEMGQPLFPILLAIGFTGLLLFVILPYNTFGEDIKMLKDAGLATVMVLSILLAVWTASTTISEEIEGRTALTVLSKPINRRAFLFGKFLGIVWTVGLMFVILGAFLLVLVAYKPIYDAKEASQAGTTWELCHLEMVLTIPGLVLGFLETVVMAALSVAIATRLPMLANFVLCFAIYAVGHMTPLIVQSWVGRFEIVSFVGQLLAVVFPNLEHFNIQAAVAAGVGVPLIYLGWAVVYCVIYSTAAMLLALLLFEDRDLA